MTCPPPQPPPPALACSFGSDALREQLLRNMSGLALLGAYAATEAAGGTDPASIATTAVSLGGGYTLNGTKTLVAGGGLADVYLVLARTAQDQPGKGLTLFLVKQVRRVYGAAAQFAHVLSCCFQSHGPDRQDSAGHGAHAFHARLNALRPS